jgi:adenylate kinase
METLRVLIIGMPFTPIFELGDRLSQFHEMDLFTVEAGPNVDLDGYFADKIPSSRLDTGDMSDGSEQQQWSRDWDSFRKSREMDNVSMIDPDSPLDDDERGEIESIVRGIVVSQVPDLFLAEWADCVVMLTVDDKKIRNWLMGRRKCFSCGAVFHMIDKPPRAYPLCDRCGTTLDVQDCDSPVFVNQQYAAWKRNFNRLEKLMKEEKGGRFVEIDVDNCKDFQEITDRTSGEIRKMVDIDLKSIRWTYSI